MHALHLPPRHLWRMGLIALALTLAVVVVGALVAPTLADLAAPSSTRTDTAVSTTSAPSAPAWVTDPMAPPSLLRTR
jgi:hypothetical protein